MSRYPNAFVDSDWFVTDGVEIVDQPASKVIRVIESQFEDRIIRSLPNIVIPGVTDNVDDPSAVYFLGRVHVKLTNKKKAPEPIEISE